MKFLKLRLKNVPQDNGFAKPNIKDDLDRWCLVIDNEEDLKAYHEVDAYANMETFMSLEREKDGSIRTSHVGAASTRAISMVRVLGAKQSCLEEGEKMYPIIEVAKYTDQKYLAMYRHIKIHGAIQINPAGGWCGLQGFIKTWDAEILEEIEKKSAGFPVEDEVLKADTLVLENAHPDYFGSNSEWSAKKLVPDCGSVKTIYHLREVDTDYVFKCVENCKNVFISTELQNEKQLDTFIYMFSKVTSKKNIYLQMSKENEEKVKAHPLFSKINHHITFLNN